MLRLDIGTGGGDAAATGLHDALEIVGRDASGAEDVAVSEVSGVTWLVWYGYGNGGERRTG